MNHEIENIVNELHQLEERKRTKHPGFAITQLLKKMAEDSVYSNEQLKEYADELWMTAAQFEKELQEEKEAYRCEMEAKKFQFQARTDGIRAQTSFRIDALESAIIETKLKYMKQAE